MSWTNHIQEQLVAVKRSPGPFAIAVLLASIFGSGALYWFFNWEMWNVLEMKDRRIAELKEDLKTNKKTKPDEEMVNDLALFLQFTDDHSEPKEVTKNNIRYWRSVRSEGYHLDLPVDKKGKSLGIVNVPYRWWIFIVFDKPAKYRQMFVKCSNSERLQCSLGSHNQEHAIVWMIGDASQATLELSVTQ